MKYYKLINNLPVRCTLVEAGLWLIDNPGAEIVAVDGPLKTVFLNITEDKCFESQLGEKPLKQYNSYEEALKGHKSLVKKYL